MYIWWTTLSQNKPRGHCVYCGWGGNNSGSPTLSVIIVSSYNAFISFDSIAAHARRVQFYVKARINQIVRYLTVTLSNRQSVQRILYDFSLFMFGTSDDFYQM